MFQFYESVMFLLLLIALFNSLTLINIHVTYGSNNGRCIMQFDVGRRISMTKRAFREKHFSDSKDYKTRIRERERASNVHLA